MSTSHTKAPWVKFGWQIVSEIDGKTICTIQCGTKNQNIPGLHEAEINADVIAAAPDFLLAIRCIEKTTTDQKAKELCKMILERLNFSTL